MSQWTADEFDISLRAAAMAFLDRLCMASRGSVRSESLLGFEFAGKPFRLMAPQQGIWKPRELEAALSIRTVHSPRPEDRPYDDAVGADGRLRYKWRGTDPAHADNRALRRAMQLQRPLIWFWGVAPATYLPIYPVFLRGEETSSHQFVVSLDEDELQLLSEPTLALTPLQRRYAERVVRQRLHQPLFRERVLLAYENRCALCRLRPRRRRRRRWG